MELLSKIKSPDDLKVLSDAQLDMLCEEIRAFLIDHVMISGGHLASNLGVVELTVAMHRVFDMPQDKIIFDVGHQSYVHKMLTGRLDRFDTLRCKGGLSGFPKTEESIYDSFNTGHASTSISAALGMARARDLNGENHQVVAFIGDGALTGGMAFEALNDAGASKTKLIIVLNDNEMSISKNVGGLSEYLSRLRSAPKYSKTKHGLKNFLKKFGRVGDGIVHVLDIFRRSIKFATLPVPLFENLGFTYLGIIDGHNIRALTNVFERAKKMDGPVIIHTFTKKGLGYRAAEESPHKYHGVSRSTTTLKRKDMDFSAAFGGCLTRLASENKNVVAITAAMIDGCGLGEFATAFPQRLFDVGIAEQHAVTMAAGLATNGIIPVVCIYSTFLQRAYDQILHDVCLQNLHVVFAIDRAGIVGEDGETHQGIFDLSYLSHIPNLTILSPSCYEELKQMLNFAVNECDGPVALRYPRGEIPFRENSQPFMVSCAEQLAAGDDITIVATGRTVSAALSVCELLTEHGIKADVLNLRTVKPFDVDSVKKSVEKTHVLVTIEDNICNGGMGSFVRSFLGSLTDVRMMHFGFGDCFVPHGKPKELFEEYGMTPEKIVEKIIKECGQK